MIGFRCFRAGRSPERRVLVWWPQGVVDDRVRIDVMAVDAEIRIHDGATGVVLSWAKADILRCVARHGRARRNICA